MLEAERAREMGSQMGSNGISADDGKRFNSSSQQPDNQSTPAQDVADQNAKSKIVALNGLSPSPGGQSSVKSVTVSVSEVTSANTDASTIEGKGAEAVLEPPKTPTDKPSASDTASKEPSTMSPYQSSMADPCSDKDHQSNKPNPTASVSHAESKANTTVAKAPPYVKVKRSTKPKKSKAHLRKGKWTPEEEEYTMRIIQHFRTGLLSLPDGHTLRSYLAEKLNCDPMRITKKFSGASCLGKRVYNLCDRSQVSSRDLELAKLELVALERRFRLRIEHGSSIPVSTHFSERLRNTRSELDHANFMRASYLFVNNPAQDQINGGGDLNSQASQGIAPNNYGNPNFSLAFLQTLANGQNQVQQRAQSIPSHQSFQQNASLQNRLQLENQLHRQQQANPPVRRNGATSFFDIQQQQQQSQINTNLLSALMNSQLQNVPAPPQTNKTAQQLSALNVLNQNHTFPNPPESSMKFDDRAGQIPGRVLQPGPTGLMLNQEPNNSTMDALAARYNSAALTSKLQQQQMTYARNDQLDAGRNASYPSSFGDRREAPNGMNTAKKIRSKEEQAEGRILLGFLQELQSNHQKAKLSSLSSAQDAVPQLQSSTATSSDDTLSTRESLNSATQNNYGGKGQKDNILKRGFDISLKKENGAETSSTVSSYFESVPNNEALSGSSGGSSGGNESTDDKEQGGSSGDDDKDLRAGPLRKRFRRTASQSPEGDV